MCHHCAPDLQLVKCTVCSRERPAAEFRGSVAALLQQSHRRCNDCRRCSACSTFYENARSMISDSRLCTRCNTKHHCKICGKIYPSKDFPDSQLHHKGDPDRNIFLRCTKCHTCTECTEEKDIHAFDGDSSTCTTCRKLQCQICNKSRSYSEFPCSQLDNKNKPGQHLFFSGAPSVTHAHSAMRRKISTHSMGIPRNARNAKSVLTDTRKKRVNENARRPPSTLTFSTTHGNTIANEFALIAVTKACRQKM